LLSSILLLSPPFPWLQGADEKAGCLNYDWSRNLIIVTCLFTNLTEIAKRLDDNSILDKQSTTSSPINSRSSINTIWLLNANLTIEKGATLYINSTTALINCTKGIEVDTGYPLIIIIITIIRSIATNYTISDQYILIICNRVTGCSYSII
jgi:hypothetical protein